VISRIASSGDATTMPGSPNAVPMASCHPDVDDDEDRAFSFVPRMHGALAAVIGVDSALAQVEAAGSHARESAHVVPPPCVQFGW
jgi:hypothetical protein